MFTQLESLIVFSHSASMADAAGRLRISQSALSKRLAALEHQLGYSLIEHHGRRAVLTSQAQQLLDRIEPLVAEMNDAVLVSSQNEQLTLSIALADAIMVSWGATLMARLKAAFPTVSVEVHGHRTAAVIERLSRGQYQLGLVTGTLPEKDGLIVSPLVKEPMAIIPCQGKFEEFEAWRSGETAELAVCCIEQKSAMWNFLAPNFKPWRLNPESAIESSVGAARLAIEGFQHALVPQGVAQTIAHTEPWLALEPKNVAFHVPDALHRPCSMASRKTVLNHPRYKEIFTWLTEEALKIVENPPIN